MGLGRACLASALAAAALAGCVAAPAQATFQGENGKIAFAAFDGPDISIYTMNPDGGGRSPLITGGESPAWSADGRKLTYFADPLDAAKRGLSVANADGSGQTVIRAAMSRADEFSSEQQNFVEPAWSPDGGTIAYEDVVIACSHPSCIVNEQGIHAIGSDGSGNRRLSLQGFPARNPGYSPDGLRLAWDDGRIHVSNPDGTGDTVLGPGYDPSWSPDGTRIAFSRYVGCCSTEVHVMNADGSDERRLTFDVGRDFDSDPVWSPDGTKIAWSHQGELWVMNADGTDKARLADGFTPDWQPLVGPQRADYKNASHFCKALREFLGDQEFAQRYRNHGGCVSRSE